MSTIYDIFNTDGSQEEALVRGHIPRIGDTICLRPGAMAKVVDVIWYIRRAAGTPHMIGAPRVVIERQRD